MFRKKTRQTAKVISRNSTAAMLMLLAGSSLAASEPAAYNMAVIKDSAHGGTVLSGDYDRGIAKITSYGTKKANTFAAKNNLCVAYTIKRKFDEAAPVCEAALQISERYVRHGSSPLNAYSTRDQALAYSNRGVLRAMTGDVEGAREDFEFAASIHQGLEAPAINLARLKSKEEEVVSTL